MRQIAFALIGAFALCAASAATHTLWLPPAGMDSAAVTTSLARCQDRAGKAIAKRTETANDLLAAGVTLNTRGQEDVAAAQRRACLLQANWLEVKLSDQQWTQYQKLPDGPDRVAFLKQISPAE